MLTMWVSFVSQNLLLMTLFCHFRSTWRYTGHRPREQSTEQVTDVVKVDGSKSPDHLGSSGVIAEDPKQDLIQPSSQLSVIHTDGTETENGSHGCCFCEDTSDNDGTKQHWKRWQRDFRQDFWAGLREPFGFIEAMGWVRNM